MDSGSTEIQPISVSGTLTRQISKEEICEREGGIVITTLRSDDIGNLAGFKGVALSGIYKNCEIEIEIDAEVALITITGIPAGSTNEVAWEASASDLQGVWEWMDDFGLVAEAKSYQRRKLE